MSKGLYWAGSDLLANIAFTSSPTVPAVSTTDNSTKIATASFCKSIIPDMMMTGEYAMVPLVTHYTSYAGTLTFTSSAPPTGATTINTTSFTPNYGESYIIIEYFGGAAYGGAYTDQWYSQIFIDGTTLLAQNTTTARTGGGGSGGCFFPIIAKYKQNTKAAISISLVFTDVTPLGADDAAAIASLSLKITELQEWRNNSSTQIYRTISLSSIASTLTFTATYTPTAGATMCTYSYTPAAAQTFVSIEFLGSYSCGTTGADLYNSQIQVNGTSIAQQTHNLVNLSSGGRNCALLPITGLYSNRSASAMSITLYFVGAAATNAITIANLSLNIIEFYRC
jgi:hypothetical protein